MAVMVAVLNSEDKDIGRTEEQAGRIVESSEVSGPKFPSLTFPNCFQIFMLEEK